MRIIIREKNALKEVELSSLTTFHLECRINLKTKYLYGTRSYAKSAIQRAEIHREIEAMRAELRKRYRATRPAGPAIEELEIEESPITFGNEPHVEMCPTCGHKRFFMT